MYDKMNIISDKKIQINLKIYFHNKIYYTFISLFHYAIRTCATDNHIIIWSA